MTDEQRTEGGGAEEMPQQEAQRGLLTDVGWIALGAGINRGVDDAYDGLKAAGKAAADKLRGHGAGGKGQDSPSQDEPPAG